MTMFSLLCILMFIRGSMAKGAVTEGIWVKYPNIKVHVASYPSVQQADQNAALKTYLNNASWNVSCLGD